MSASNQTVFVTGASGFLGSHIVAQLLENGYRVRAAARGSKVDDLKTSYAPYGDQFQVVPITDITSDQFLDALKDIFAVIHSAAPIAERAEPHDLLKGAIDGTLNVVRQAERAGITRIVVTSSIASVSNPSRSFTDQDWNPMTREQTLEATTKFDIYRGAKTLAERELWDFADAHPHIDITTLNPPFLYGPFVKEFMLPTPNYYALSTNLYLYRILTKEGSYPGSPFYADVRDVAAAHVRALTAPLSTEPGIGRKRLIMAAIYPFDFDGIKNTIAERRPGLKDRLTSAAAPVFPLKQLPHNMERLEQVLGMRRSDFKPFEDTILEALDSLVKMEKEWVEKGYTIQIPQN